jgi:hypothetical protein
MLQRQLSHLSGGKPGLNLLYFLCLSRVRVPWDLRPYFTVSDLRLPFSSPPTTRRVTVEVFDRTKFLLVSFYNFGSNQRENTTSSSSSVVSSFLVCLCVYICIPLIDVRKRFVCQATAQNVPAATYTYAPIEELLDSRFLCGPYNIKGK